MIALGQQFGRWTVLEPGHRNRHTQHWRCRCECGTVRELQQGALTRGATHSCGCWRSERRKAHPVKVRHGGARREHVLPEYRVWHTMWARCENPNIPGFKYWGGRGIRVCPEWAAFERFLADVGPRPSPQHSIDRINNDGHYEPGNVRWATRSQQQTNRRDTLIVTHEGESLPVAEWNRRAGLPQSTLRHRLRLGWPMAVALSTPVRAWHRHS